jgi:uncharacterized membrane protein
VVIVLIAIDAFNLASGAWIAGLAVLIGVSLLTIAGLNAASAAPQDHLRSIALAVGAIGGVWAIALTIADNMSLGLAISFASAGAVIWLVGDSIGARFTGALVAAGASIVAGVELVFLADDLAPDPVYYRMNTVFKFYNQVWTLFAISAAVLLTLMAARFLAPVASVVAPADGAEPDPDPEAVSIVPSTLRMNPRPKLIDLVRRHWVQIGVVSATILLCGSLFYPLFSTAPRLEQRFPGHPGVGTLNALDWMRNGTIARPDGDGVIAFSDDLAAIEWFNSEIQGTPVIAEASIGPYRGNGSRISIATGLPSVLGWERHERQQRYPEGIAERFRDVRTLYDSSDPNEKLAVLRKYDVQYLVVGDVERYSVWSGHWYASAAGIAAFDQMVGTSLEVAFQSGTTTVYRILPPDIVAGAAAEASV